MICFIKHGISAVNFTVIFLFSNHIKHYPVALNYNWLISPSIRHFIALLFFWYLGIACCFSIGSMVNPSFTRSTLLLPMKYYSIDGWQSFLLFYSAAFWLIPGYFYKRKYHQFVGYLIILLVAYAVAGYFSNKIIFPENVGFLNGKTELNIFFWHYFLFQFIAGVQFIFFAAGFRLLLDYLQIQKREVILENEKNKAELSFLRTQINPHILFNALNNIYSLAQKKSDLAPDAILNLSGMMRHILYEKEDVDQKVTLDSEIELLENYLDLQRLRFSDQLFIDFIVKGKTQDKKIAPLLLLPLIENAFKHGVVIDPEIPLAIRLFAENDRLLFFVGNKKKSGKVENEPGGIGLANVTKRLNLQYPDNHKLIIEEDEITYKLSLTIFFYD